MKDQKISLKCKDFMVSQESFELVYNQQYEMLATQPIPSNLEKYYMSDAYISHTDGNGKLLDKIYKRVRNFTLKKKLRLVNSFQNEEKKILDVGCGTGDFLLTCKKNQWITFGIEPNKQARQISEKKGVFSTKTLNELNESEFDIITLWHVLEHVENLKEYILLLKQKLKSNGVLIVAVPNYKSYDANFYKEFWAAYDVPRHLWHFSQTSIQKLFSEISMDVVKTLPMKFDSYYVSLLSEKYKNGKTSFFKAFYIGFKSNLKAITSSEYSSLIYIIKKQK